MSIFLDSNYFLLNADSFLVIFLPLIGVLIRGGLLVYALGPLLIEHDSPRDSYNSLMGANTV